MKNLDVRAAVKSAGVYFWQVAEALGMRDDTFSRKLRHELPVEEKEQIFSIIKQMSAEKEV